MGGGQQSTRQFWAGTAFAGQVETRPDGLAGQPLDSAEKLPGFSEKPDT